MSEAVPIVVDLDGTLVREDTLYVFAFQLLLRKPWVFFILPFKLLKGKAAMKAYMNTALAFNPSSLSFNQALIDWLRERKQAGHQIALCTASSQTVADITAAKVDVFDQVFGSGSETNLSGSRKANFLNEQYGAKNYIYCGNADVDLKVWQHSHSAVVVNAPKGLAQEATQHCPVIEIFD
ncbi:MAG: haloacid dehalogenase-like hydrolase [Pseudomonadota bacterium]